MMIRRSDRGTVARTVVLLGLLLSIGPTVRLSAQCPDGSAPPCRVGAAGPRAVADSVVAVLPFRAVGPQLGLWREGLVDLLAMGLDGVGGLHAVAPQRVIAHVQRLPRAADALEPSAARQVARELGAATYLTGSAVTTGPGRVRLLVERYDVRSGRKRLDASFVIDGPEHDLAALADSAALLLLARLSRVSIPVSGGTRWPTSSVPAMRAFLLGEQAFRAGRWSEADGRYEDALQFDSTFALALYRRFQLRYRGQVASPPSDVQLATRALVLAHRLPERELLLLQAVRRGSDYLDSTDYAARRAFTERYPNDPEGWVWLAEWYHHAGGEYGHPISRVLEAGRRALALDSTLWTAYHHPIEAAAQLGNTGTVRDLLARYLRLVEPGDRVARAQQLAAQLWQLPSDSALGVVPSLAPESDGVLSRLIGEYLRFDRRPVALAIADAIATLQVRVARRPDVRDEARARLTELQAARGRLRDAERALIELRRDDPQHLNGALSGVLPVLAGLTEPRGAFAQSIATLKGLAAAILAGGPADFAEISALTTLSRLDAAQGDTLAALARSRALRGRGAPSEALERLIELDSAVVAGWVALARRDTSAVLAALLPTMRAAAATRMGAWRADAADRLLLARLLAARGDRPRARALLDWPDREPMLGGGALGLRLLLAAELAELDGDHAVARRRFGDLIELWRDGDAAVQPYVERARAALARLEGL